MRRGDGGGGGGGGKLFRRQTYAEEDLLSKLKGLGGLVIALV